MTASGTGTGATYFLCLNSVLREMIRRGRQAKCLPPSIFMLGAGFYFMQRYRKLTICARVQEASGPKESAAMPLVMPFATAHRTASW